MATLMIRKWRSYQTCKLLTQNWFCYIESTLHELPRMLLLELINFKLQRNFSVKRRSVHFIKLAADDRWPSWTSKCFDKFMMFSVLNRLLFPSERKSSKINKAATSFNKNIYQWSLINCVANKIQQCDNMKVDKWCSLMRFLIQWIPFFANSGLSHSW